MSKRVNTGGPAFPGSYSYIDGMSSSYEGMTLRDWFAGQAVASGAVNDDPGEAERLALGIPDDASQVVVIAAVAYHIADAMMAEKAKADAANLKAREEEMDNDRPF